MAPDPAFERSYNQPMRIENEEAITPKNFVLYVYPQEHTTSILPNAVKTRWPK